MGGLLKSLFLGLMVAALSSGCATPPEIQNTPKLVKAGQGASSSISTLFRQLAKEESQQVVLVPFLCKCDIDAKIKTDIQNNTRLWLKAAEDFDALGGLYGAFGEMADSDITDSASTSAESAAKAASDFSSSIGGSSRNASDFIKLAASDIAQLWQKKNIKEKNLVMIEILKIYKSGLTPARSAAENLMNNERDEFKEIARDSVINNYAKLNEILSNQFPMLGLDWDLSGTSKCMAKGGAGSDRCRFVLNSYGLVESKIDSHKENVMSSFDEANRAMNALIAQHQKLSTSKQLDTEVVNARVARLKEYVDAVKTFRGGN